MTFEQRYGLIPPEIIGYPESYRQRDEWLFIKAVWIKAQKEMRYRCADQALSRADTPCCEVHRMGNGHTFDCPVAVAEEIRALEVK
jgi:hypothetical protein